MRCLYCGKEIGAFRLLRDSEFCGTPHRKNYGARLGKALHQMAAPEPPPAPVANFVPRWPLQDGHTKRSLSSWQTSAFTPLSLDPSWPMAIECCLGQRHRSLAEVPPIALERRLWNQAKWRVPSTPIRLPRLNSAPEPMPVTDRASNIPPKSDRWAPVSAADPVASFVRPVSALNPRTLNQATLTQAMAPRLPALIEMPRAPKVPAPAGACQTSPPDPAARFVRMATALTPAAFDTAAFTPTCHLAGPVQTPSWQKTLPAAGVVQASAAEPLAIFVRPATALRLALAVPVQRYTSRLDMPACRGISGTAGYAGVPAPEPSAAFVRPATALTPALTLSLTSAELSRAPGFAGNFEIAAQLHAFSIAGPCPAPVSEPVARFVRTATALTRVVCATAPRLPQPGIAAELEPLPVPDKPLQPPAICLRAMASPAADPVCRFVESVNDLCPIPALPRAVLFQSALHHLAPRFSRGIDAPHVPCIMTPRPAAAPAPVMAGVRPHARAIPLTPIIERNETAGAVLLPLEVPALVQEQWALATRTPGLAAEPAESFLVAAAAAIPMVRARAECRVPKSAGFVLANCESAPAMGRLAAGLQAAPLECLLRTSVAAAQHPKATMRIANMRIPDFTIRASNDLMAPGFDVAHLLPHVSQPRPGSRKVFPLSPMAIISVAAPAQKHERFSPAMPQPGMQQVEFHAQRSRGVIFGRPDWKAWGLVALPPRFTLGPVFEKFGEAAPQQKALRPEPEFIKTYQMPAAKRPSAVLLLGGKIAAGVLLAASAWYGYSSLHGGHRLANGMESAAVETVLPSGSAAARTAAVTAGGAKAVAAAAGPVGWMRQSIARRASVQATENFRGSMQSWGFAKTYPAGWSHHPDGYINTGALALFHPSLKFKDYRLEFFGQIENKGMSWSVRATDSKNYHAMKVAVMEAGLRPFIALVHWDVIDGKAGRQSRTPLNVMVHNNRPIQVAVNVEGNHLVTSIDGEEVDSFTNDTLASGGVGFFSEANERARVYWMRVSKNDDWLGHVCAFLSGEDAVRATAELHGPGFPGNAPTPWMPDEKPAGLAAAWIGLPYLHVTSRARVSNTRRSNPSSSHRSNQWNT